MFKLVFVGTIYAARVHFYTSILTPEDLSFLFLCVCTPQCGGGCIINHYDVYSHIIIIII